jgi:hypothetical protein
MEDDLSNSETIWIRPDDERDRNEPITTVDKGALIDACSKGIVEQAVIQALSTTAWRTPLEHQVDRPLGTYSESCTPVIVFPSTIESLGYVLDFLLRAKALALCNWRLGSTTSWNRVERFKLASIPVVTHEFISSAWTAEWIIRPVQNVLHGYGEGIIGEGNRWRRGTGFWYGRGIYAHVPFAHKEKDPPVVRCFLSKRSSNDGPESCLRLYLLPRERLEVW